MTFVIALFDQLESIKYVMSYFIDIMQKREPQPEVFANFYLHYYSIATFYSIVIILTHHEMYFLWFLCVNFPVATERGRLQ